MKKILLFSTTLFFSMFSIAMAWDGNLYSPGTTLNPDCSPLTANCDVEAVTISGSDIIPSAANTYSLGSATYPWKDLYVSADSISINGVKLSNNNGQLTWSGSGGIVASSPTSNSDIGGNLSVGGTSSLQGLSFAAATGTSLVLSGSISASNFSGTNTGDETSSTIKTKLGVASASSDGYLSSLDWNTFNSKEGALTAGTTSQYYRGDKTWQTLDKSAVGLSNVENTALSTWSGSSNLNTVGIVTSGTWNGSDIVLGSHTSGNYVAGATSNSGLAMTGSEAATLGIQLDGDTLSLGVSGLKISDDLTSDWNEAFSWGNHADAGYLTPSSSSNLTNKSGNVSMWTNDTGYLLPSSLYGYATEAWSSSIFQPIGSYLTTISGSDLDNIFSSSPTGILKKNANGSYTVDTSSYLTSYTETDPIFSISSAAGITASDMADWNGKISLADLSAIGPITYDNASGAIGFNNPGYITENQIVTLSGVLSGSGTTSIAASAAAGYYMPTTTDQTDWNSAYANRITSASYPLSILSNALSLGYNSTNLQLTSDQLNTIQDIATTSTPAFAGLTTTGNVGVNTALPTSLLHVHGAGNSSSTSALKVDNSDGTTSLLVNDDGSIVTGYKIDVVSPSQTFGSAQLYLKSSSGNNSYIVYNDGGDNRWMVRNIEPDHSYDIFNFNTYSSALRILSNGNIGLGVDSPTANLSLPNGGIINSLGALTINSNSTNALTIDSGTTGAINIGTNANAKTVSIGNSTGATAINIISGTGGINLGDATALPTIDINGGNARLIAKSPTNLFLGYQAGNSSLTGVNNIGFGRAVGGLITSGNRNIIVGRNAGINITSGSDNLAFGDRALNALTTASQNISIGTDTGLLMTSGTNNVAIGYQAMDAATTAVQGVIIGAQAGGALTTGDSNTLIGFQSGQNLTTGYSNVFIGTNTDKNATTIRESVAIGMNAGVNATTGNGQNTYVGYNAGNSHTSQVGLTYVGYNAGTNATTGIGGTFIGTSAGDHVTTGSNNTFLGYQAGHAITTTSGGTGLGYQALLLATGANNIGVGSGAGANITTGANNIIIGNISAPSATASNQLDIGNLIYGDLSSKFVGIGTSTPTHPLSINPSGGGVSLNFGNYMDTEVALTSSDGITYIGDESSDQTVYWMTDGGIANAAITTNPSLPTYFAVNGSNVGIGTNDPQEKLDVAGGARFDSDINVNGSVHANGLEINGEPHFYQGEYFDPAEGVLASVKISEDASQDGLDMAAFASAVGGEGSGQTTYAGYFNNLSTNTNNYGIYVIGGNNYFSGKIGIGKEVPEYALDVNGAIQSSDALRAPALIYGGGSGNNGLEIDNTEGSENIIIKLADNETASFGTTKTTLYGYNGSYNAQLVFNNGLADRWTLQNNQSNSNNFEFYNNNLSRSTALIDNSDSNASKFKIVSPNGGKTTQLAVDQAWDVGQVYTTAGSLELWGGSTKQLTLTSSSAVFVGKVGIGNSSPSTALYVGSSSVSDGNQATIQDNNGTCTLNPGSGASWSCTSDENLKHDIEDLNGGLDIVLKLRPTTFAMNADNSLRTGFIAQEVQEILPGLVTQMPDGTLGLAEGEMMPYVVSAIKELSDKITGLFNGLGDIFVHQVDTEVLCVGKSDDKVCITKDELEALLKERESSPQKTEIDINNPIPEASASENPLIQEEGQETVYPDTLESDETKIQQEILQKNTGNHEENSSEGSVKNENQ
jgi:hypothetical protein